MKYYLIACGAWNLVRAFLHAFNHGYDIVFELRMIQCLIPLGFAALVIVAEQFLEKLPMPAPHLAPPTEVIMPTFETLDDVPPKMHVAQKVIYIRSTGNFYWSNGACWNHFK